MAYKVISEVFDAQTATKAQKKKGLSGLVVEFITNEKLKIGDVVRIKYKTVYKFFKIGDVENTLSGEQLYRAVEYGYADKFIINNREITYDPNALLNVSVELVDDEETLESLNMMSNW